MEEMKISVRSLVEFIMRSGDIDDRRGAMADKEAMQLGSKLHRKIQGQMGSNYRAEVPLSYRYPCGEFEIVVEGRADGIQEEKELVVIDEIKGVYRDLSYLEEPVGVHLAQAKCYAYIYAKEQALDKIGVQMTYCNLETEDIKRFRESFTEKELEEWFNCLLKEYGKWCAFSFKWKQQRQESVKQVVFPFPYREGQKELAAAVYRTFARGKKLFIEAPTGVGKTISTVFPAVKAVGEGLGDKIFYLTAKTITRTVAGEAFALLKEQGLQYKVATLTAKEKICPMEKKECNPDACPYAKGHFDRVNDAVFELLGQTDDFDREVLLKQAEKWQVCPFEMGLDVSLWVDAIICDYNYVFDPRAHLKRFFGDSVKGDYLFLIDEAHNLVERGREMYSAVLYKEDFLEVRRAVKPYSRKLEKYLSKCNEYLLALKRECEDFCIIENVGSFALSLMNLAGEMEEFLEEEHGEVRDLVLDLYFAVRTFLDIHERLDENYVIYTEMEESGQFKLKLFCVNPAANLASFLEKGRGTVFFSATLLPVQYYIKLLSTREDDYTIYANSPFDTSRKLLLIGSDISSKYTRRNKAGYEKIAAYIKKVSEHKKGNYLAFFPSYKMLADVAECFEAIRGETRMLLQSSGMNEEEREGFLAQFDTEGGESLVGFCVMGGIFGEGIDLKHDRLIGAIVVGTGIPQICNERSILKGFYDEKGTDGFDYAYRYPGMNKVLQSAGRVIRTQEDEGVIVLLDDRFLQREYLSLFPVEWSDFQICTLSSIEEKLGKFWSERGEDS